MLAPRPLFLSYDLNLHALQKGHIGCKCKKDNSDLTEEGIGKKQNQLHAPKGASINPKALGMTKQQAF